jgi:hypothetical protein
MLIQFEIYCFNIAGQGYIGIGFDNRIDHFFSDMLSVEKGKAFEKERRKATGLQRATARVAGPPMEHTEYLR